MKKASSSLCDVNIPTGFQGRRGTSIRAFLVCKGLQTRILISRPTLRELCLHIETYYHRFFSIFRGFAFLVLDCPHPASTMPLSERNLNILHRTPPAQKTSTPQSKLPRRVPTPNSTPTVTKWTPRHVDRVQPGLKHANESQGSSEQMAASVPRRAYKVFISNSCIHSNL